MAKFDSLSVFMHLNKFYQISLVNIIINFTREICKHLKWLKLMERDSNAFKMVMFS